MSSPHRRAVKAFLLGPLYGTAVCSVFAFLFLHGNWLLLIYVIEAVLICTYIGAMIVGLPLYLLFVAGAGVRPNWFVYVFSSVALIVWLWLFRGHFDAKGAVTWFVLCAVAGFATGAVFAGLLRPPLDRVADR
jgi:hypothetical protein